MKDYFRRDGAVAWWNPDPDQKYRDVVEISHGGGKRVLEAAVGKGRFLTALGRISCNERLLR